jgi:hypothetical protein
LICLNAAGRISERESLEVLQKGIPAAIELQEELIGIQE